MTEVSETSRMAEKLDNKISDHENIARIIKEKGPITQMEIKEATSFSKGFISQAIKTLRDEGLIYLMKEKRGKKNQYKWVGGVPALEDELQSATSKYIPASLLAENYDTMITEAFSLVSLLFEGDYWEVIMNLKEGLTDTELHQHLGNDISLDSIRRVLVTSDAHNLIKLKRIREVSGNDQIKIFEPLYRIDEINRDYLMYMILLRGLASAIQIKMENKAEPGFSNLYGEMLDRSIEHFIWLRNKILSGSIGDESELLTRLLQNYDFAPDLDRIYRDNGNWRLKITESKNLKIDSNDHLVVVDSFIRKQ